MIITGQARLTRDPDAKFTPKGTCVCQFGIATNRKYSDGNGGTKEETYFGDVEAWGNTAETVAKFFKKGDAIILLGRLKTESWDDKTTGQKRTRTRIVLQSFEFPAGRDRRDGNQDAPRVTGEPKAAMVKAAQPETSDDVPF